MSNNFECDKNGGKVCQNKRMNLTTHCQYRMHKINKHLKYVIEKSVIIMGIVLLMSQ